MKVVYSKHARWRMKRREITRVMVVNALKNAQERKWFSDSEIVKCVYVKEGKELVIIYKQTKEIYKIITLYFKQKI
ncbi:MAG: DUF4258 domain-containing protein [Patescibacteria group bacterium]